MPHAQSSHVYDCFERDDKNKTYKCIEKKKNGEECGSIIKVDMWNPCSSLKRHLERFHAEKSKKVKQADEQDLKLKKKEVAIKQAAVDCVPFPATICNCSCSIRSKTMLLIVIL